MSLMPFQDGPRGITGDICGEEPETSYCCEPGAWNFCQRMEEDIVYSHPHGIDDQRCYEDSKTGIKHFAFFDTYRSAGWLMDTKILLLSIFCWSDRKNSYVM